ncbi:hypothetical protein IAF52_05640 [Acinetobacter baumannii]|uniref:hypothetical protein n=1 Tax=Acinetobacter baumannii TaxID=470 RepID=UPI000628677A|nr:hypothetical protein [Acinetobacter baumannii]KAA0673191.1 hypothetical protein CJU83_12565 [Acinetobacter baumannii]KAA3495501.1 hypothetical protein CVG52_12120 [Acinetobacter baumannii]KAF0613656.1 hypothetical protein CLM70_12810 [Acinetobacter baumannii]KQK36634.1 hypothetical protein AQ481_11780 [Acinetobacter baumannii]KUI78122.1 hypothetical protein AQ480_01020 [Acinetobacter baumannii]
MSYLVIKDLGHNFYLGKRGPRQAGKEFLVFKSEKEILVGAESYTYDESSNKLLWEGIENLGQVVVGFADTEEEAIDSSF